MESQPVTVFVVTVVASCQAALSPALCYNQTHGVLCYLCVLVLDFMRDAGALLSNLPALLVIVRSKLDYPQAGAPDRVRAAISSPILCWTTVSLLLPRLLSSSPHSMQVSCYPFRPLTSKRSEAPSAVSAPPSKLAQLKASLFVVSCLDSTLPWPLHRLRLGTTATLSLFLC